MEQPGTTIIGRKYTPSAPPKLFVLTEPKTSICKGWGKRQNVWRGEAESSKIVYEGTPYDLNGLGQTA
jgi:hypothetical protein